MPLQHAVHPPGTFLKRPFAVLPLLLLGGESSVLLLVRILKKGSEAVAEVDEVSHAALGVVEPLLQHAVVQELLEGGDLGVLNVIVDPAVTVVLPDSRQDLILDAADAEDGQLAVPLEELLRVYDPPRVPRHLLDAPPVVRLEPLPCKLVSPQAALGDGRVKGKLEVSLDLRRQHDVALRRYKHHLAVLTVHQQLAAEVLAEHVLCRLVVDSTLDVGDDPDAVSVLQVVLDDLVPCIVLVVDSGCVHQRAPRLQEVPVAPLHPHPLDQRPELPLLHLVGRVHEPLQLALELLCGRGLDLGGLAAVPRHPGAELELPPQLRDGGVDPLPLPQLVVGLVRCVGVVAPKHSVELAPRRVVVGVWARLHQDGPPVLLREVVQDDRELRLPLLGGHELDLAEVGLAVGYVVVGELDDGCGARPHAIGGQHVCLPQQRVQQRRLACASVPHRHNAAPRHDDLPLRLVELRYHGLLHAGDGPPVVLLQRL
mmetsp:Transcript_32721/g.82540  ORF Transcript_32721/g.82540 Transcript_32721/m.82540 type:complete len:483 (-) Transcript_32721:159-1607(-)